MSSPCRYFICNLCSVHYWLKSSGIQRSAAFINTFCTMNLIHCFLSFAHFVSTFAIPDVDFQLFEHRFKIWIRIHWLSHWTESNWTNQQCYHFRLIIIKMDSMEWNRSTDRPRSRTLYWTVVKHLFIYNSREELRNMPLKWFSSSSSSSFLCSL